MDDSPVEVTFRFNPPATAEKMYDRFRGAADALEPLVDGEDP